MLKLNGFAFVSHKQNCQLATQSYADFRSAWPEFMNHNKIALGTKEYLLNEVGDWQVFLVNIAGDVVAICKSIPMTWDGTLDDLPDGYDMARQRAVEEHKDRVCANTLLLLSITVPGRFRGHEVSRTALTGLKQLAKDNGLRNVIVPVRPPSKVEYPELPIEDTLKELRDDGLPVDSWLRTHIRLGGKILREAPESFVIEGTVGEWEGWTGLHFPISGLYRVKGALSLVSIDIESDYGRYCEPNIWVGYDLG